MARKLASIQKITALNPIAEADKIEVASILGWKVVVLKDQFKVGDAVVYAEIDSILPDKPEFEFMRERKFRVRTIRLRGQISQGIAFPLSILPAGTPTEEGTDVTDILGIEKYIYQIPANLAGQVKGAFPDFLMKTDETRIQVLQDVLTRNKGKICYVTEKVDGSSVSFYLNKGEFGVCSRNLELKETPENLIWKMARTLKIEEKLRETGYNVCIQGEIIGLGIQKNNLRLDENKILFFNAFDIDKFRYYDFPEFKNFIERIGLETVPILEVNYVLDDNMDAVLEKAKGCSVLNPKVFREGIVIRTIVEDFDFKMSQGFGNGRLTFKAVNNDYLLKFDG
jgi:RNA ligase (TIGR02306 family)